MHDLKEEMWLFDEVCDHVGIYESKAAEGLSAFYVGLVQVCWKCCSLVETSYYTRRGPFRIGSFKQAEHGWDSPA